MYTLSMNGLTKPMAWGLTGVHAFLSLMITGSAISGVIESPAELHRYLILLSCVAFVMPLVDSKDALGVGLCRRPIMTALTFIAYDLIVIYGIVLIAAKTMSFFVLVIVWLVFDWVWTRLGE